MLQLHADWRVQLCFVLGLFVVLRTQIREVVGLQNDVDVVAGEVIGDIHRDHFRDGQRQQRENLSGTTVGCGTRRVLAAHCQDEREPQQQSRWKHNLGKTVGQLISEEAQSKFFQRWTANFFQPIAGKVGKSPSQEPTEEHAHRARNHNDDVACIGLKFRDVAVDSYDCSDYEMRANIAVLHMLPFGEVFPIC